MCILILNRKKNLPSRNQKRLVIRAEVNTPYITSSWCPYSLLSTKSKSDVLEEREYSHISSVSYNVWSIVETLYREQNSRIILNVNSTFSLTPEADVFS